MAIGSMQNLLRSRKNPGIAILANIILQSNKKQETIQTINHIHKRITTMQRVDEGHFQGMHDAQTANEVNKEEECDYQSMRFLRIPITR
uniref:Uncharacterized protein n=1 Tax=Glossina palpalis gambiensis TaxID=67801 RepID=A0A1B0BE48_9MUSC